MNPKPPTLLIVVRDIPTPPLDRVAAALAFRGVNSTWLRPPLVPITQHYDVVLVRAKGAEFLDWAKRNRHMAGVMLPDPVTVERVKDRWNCRSILQAAGISVPPAITGRKQFMLANFSELRRLMPVLVKERYVHRRQVQPMFQADELCGHLQQFSDGIELVAEHFLTGMHTTAHFVGDHVAVCSKQPLLGEDSETHRIWKPSETTLDYVARYRNATGLQVGKLDLVETRAGMCCVDAGVFPRFTNVLEAAPWLAELLFELLKSQAARMAA